MGYLPIYSTLCLMSSTSTSTICPMSSLNTSLTQDMSTTPVGDGIRYENKPTAQGQPGPQLLVVLAG